jgi:hypothetical protein
MAASAWRSRRIAVAVVLAGGVAAAAEARADQAAGQAPVVAAVRTAPVLAGPHVRGVRTGVHDAAKFLADAADACPSIRGLVEALERTDVVVLVEMRNDVSNGRAHLTMNGSRAGVRWLRLTVDAGHPWHQRAAFLAHELRHAVEVAAAADVQDVASFGQLYERIGRMVGPGRFETDAAVAAENLALREAYAADRRR